MISPERPTILEGDVHPSRTVDEMRNQHKTASLEGEEAWRCPCGAINGNRNRRCWRCADPQTVPRDAGARPRMRTTSW
jgi:hypothetical protein